MKQIITFSQRYLHNGEHDQLHNNLSTEIENETAEKLGITHEVTAYNVARADEKLALQKELGSAHTHPISECDGYRDELDLGFCMLIESHLYHPDTKIRENARLIQRIIDQHGNLRKLNYSDEASKLSIRNAEIKTKYTVELASIANGIATYWLDKLTNANDEFIIKFGIRGDEETVKFILTVSEARNVTDKAWEAIVKRINALVIVNGEAPYASFIDKVNYYIEYNKNTINNRKAKKEKEVVS